MLPTWRQNRADFANAHPGISRARNISPAQVFALRQGVRSMPILRYFVVAGLALVSLLFVADALLSRPDNPVFATKFDRTQAALRRDHVLSSQLADEAPHIAEIPQRGTQALATTPPTAPVSQPQAPAATAPVTEANGATTDGRKTSGTKIDEMAAAREQAEPPPVKTAKEPSAKKRQRMVQRQSRSRESDRWERQDQRRDRWDRAPWDDSYAYAPAYTPRSRDPFWFR
jgi:hypothetical protein